MSVTVKKLPNIPVGLYINVLDTVAELKMKIEGK